MREVSPRISSSEHCIEQEAQLSPRDRATRRCLRDSVFSGFGTIPVCDRQTDRQTDGPTHDDSIYRASIASRGKNLTATANNITTYKFDVFLFFLSTYVFILVIVLSVACFLA